MHGLPQSLILEGGQELLSAFRLLGLAEQFPCNGNSPVAIRRLPGQRGLLPHQ